MELHREGVSNGKPRLSDDSRGKMVGLSDTPRRSTSSRAVWLVTAVAMTGAVAGFWTSGTYDTEVFWLPWMAHARLLGPIAGYAANQGDYPPLTTTALWLASLSPLAPLVALKALLLLSTAATLITVAVMTRDAWAVALVAGLIVLNTAWLTLLDGLTALPIVLGLMAYLQRRNQRASAWLTLAAWTKWQPLLILPFFAVGLWRRPARWESVGVSAAISLLILGLFGAQPILASLLRAFSHQTLSSHAMNVGWLITWAIHRASGDLSGRPMEILTASSPWVFVPQLGAVLACMVLLLWRQLRHPDSQQAPFYATAAFLAYVTFGRGAHANHWFTPALVLSLMASYEPRWRLSALLIVGIAGANLLLFYRLDGHVLEYTPHLFGVDLSVTGAVVATGITVAMISRTLALNGRPRGEHAAGPPAPSVVREVGLQGRDNTAR